ncbi:hypothetical protein OC842_004059 [Tilletia horrida]|uniref:Uncharacterized protein n=1 Tax=Tilletia horrida TaxID=155126 RepID=A0AAN6GAI6_9BASI|nr:hypothetical protein OC842_004059 [Tilletia horrida]
MPARETQAAHPAPSHAEATLTISTALMPGLVKERARRRDDLIRTGAPGAELFRGSEGVQAKGGGRAGPVESWAKEAASGSKAGGDDAIVRARHCIMRAMAEHFIAPLSSIDGPTDPDITIISNYEIADVVQELHRCLRQSDNIILHRFPHPPERDDSMELNDPSRRNAGGDTDSSLAATTIDIWLAPRLVSAAAMVMARVAELQDDALNSRKLPDGAEDILQQMIKLQARLISFLHDLLATSALVHGTIHVQFILQALLQAASTGV